VVSTTLRATGLVAQVIDERLNSWQDHAGQDINIDTFYAPVGTEQEWDQGYWAYRGQAAVVVLPDLTIVRCRIGSDADPADRKVYRQIITDPNDAAQWVAWTQLYTGDHYAIAMEVDAGSPVGYRIFHAKSDGLYERNSLKLAQTGIVRIKTTANATGRIFFKVVSQDPDGRRKFDWYYTYIWAATPIATEDPVNYRWFHSDLAVYDAKTALYRFRAMAHGRHELSSDPRGIQASEMLTVDHGTEEFFMDPDAARWNNARYLKGPSGRAGYKIIDNLHLTRLTTLGETLPYYYLFYNERHIGLNGVVLSNHKNELFWSRSVGVPYYMSAPTPTGYTIWGFAGVVQHGPFFVYACGNGRVLRRPSYAQTRDISDYILSGGYEVPRENQKSTGTLLGANPDNELGELLRLTGDESSGMTDHRIQVAIGQKAPGDASYTWKRDDDWWITRLRKIKEQDADGGSGPERVEISIGNFWHRMEQPFMDTIVQPGHFIWSDWQPDAPNDVKNYSNDYDEWFASSPSGSDPQYIPRLKVVPSGTAPHDLPTLTLYAGQLFENGWVSLLMWQEGGIVFRYQDADNFYLADITPNDKVRLRVCRDGNMTTLASASITTGLSAWVAVDFRWSRVSIHMNDTIVLSHTIEDPALFTGFVGTTSPEVSNATISDWNAVMTTKEMLRILFGYVDEHDVQLELDEETSAAEQIETTWGPQSDLDSPEKATRQLLDASKLQVVWLEDS
jgi:hypothetical protein